MFIEADEDARVLAEAIRDGEIDDDFTDDISAKVVCLAFVFLEK